MNTQIVRGVAVLGIIASAGMANAAVHTLQDLNSTVRINDTTQAGMSDWIVDGTDHMFQQWFWFRVQGDTQERSLDTLPLLGAVTTDTNGFSDNRVDTLGLLYGNNQIQVQPTWTLRGGANTSGSSDVTESIVVSNVSNAALTISMFQYCDFDVNNSAGGDTTEIFGPRFNTVTQTDGFWRTETIATPRPTFYEAAGWPTILNRLNNATAEDLANVAGPIGPGDQAWAFEWVLNLAPGQSFVITKDKSITPAPGSVALLAIGGLIAARRRRA